MQMQSRPTVLCIAGHDPSGGAGIQADIEAVAAQGCHAATVITALTDQDTRNVYSVTVTAADLVRSQVARVFHDMRIAAVKIGVLGSVALADVVTQALLERERIPVVLDPVIVAAGGGELSDIALVERLRGGLLSRATVVTPNHYELERLAPEEDSLDGRGRALQATGDCHVLATGGDAVGAQVMNRLYAPDGRIHDFEWPRLQGVFHGSGCTLSSALAARLALGESVPQACERAQQYTAGCLRHAHAPGLGQYVPTRLVSAGNAP